MKNRMILDSLNDAQREVVTAPLGHQLVLAGAGSGKTRVLTERIAWLVQEEGLSPLNILSVTFTNKAAAEMRSRIQELLGPDARLMWVGTFHSLAHRLLRMHWKDANLPEGFQILDSDDQLRMVRRVIQALGLDEDRWPAKQAQWFINGKKDEGLEPHQLPDYGDSKARTLIKIYRAYQEACDRSGSIDFADLLLKVHRLWLNHPDILAHYQHRFRSILVDEFQDTNAIQYAFIRLLAGKENHVMIVGDDDQSIYGWRGAKVENIARFSQDFLNAKTTRLEQNYRSTGTILSAANALIAHNAGRMGKNLWTAGDPGQPIVVYAGFNDLDEARYVANRIRERQQRGESLRTVAILYRSNAQSRVLEEALLQYGIPYRVYGGLRYFERAEIKDALAYLRLLANRDDDAAFERVVNTPTRGIGERTVIALREYTETHRLSLWRSAKALLEQTFFTTRAAHALAHFLQLIETLSDDARQFELHEQVEHVIQNSGLIEHYHKEKGEKGQARLENLEELVNAARQFEVDEAAREANMSKLAAFLAHSALESGENQAETYEEGVQLMTLHSAKGLEFQVVFLCGCEEGLFPHYMTMEDPKGLEEERRLCYVGMTRAMRQLYMTYAETRRLHGREAYHRPSRFLAEIPAEFLENVRLKTKVSMPASTLSTASPGLSEYHIAVGQAVTHRQFGTGIVLQCEGRGAHARVQVRFEKAGTKWLIAS
ncbi:MAG TPA: DNA helicase II, partial [Gammaproteobacteria bacterium]|nr:DNA helicase II [Gammaproteobacteria bacterium]